MGFSQGEIERIPDDLFPLTTEPKTLTVFLKARTNVEDYSDNAFARWYEEQTGVKVDIEVGPSDATEFQQALNLRMASGDLPTSF
jgi:ABC-type glycerol-3-phosphate transport system substrate-binding protein